MNLVGQRVFHKTFGEGIIQRKDESILRVSFGEQGEKAFLYPDVFEGYLSVEEAVLYEKINDEITANHIRHQQVLEQKRLEEEARVAELLKQKAEKPKRKTASRPSKNKAS